MKYVKIISLLLTLNISLFSFTQNIADFTSLEPLARDSKFIIPSTHVFQKIIEKGDPLSQGGVLPGNTDFTGYVSIDGSSENGYLSISREEVPVGGVTILDIHFNSSTKLWETTYSQAVDFSSVAGTAGNCSGTVTPWNTIISCEETITSSLDSNNDGRRDMGWVVEIDPVTKTVIDKRWALGNFKHENISIHTNKKTVYQGADSNPGYLYKFVADEIEDLSSGSLYVYVGQKNGTGNWVRLNNTTPEQQNTTLEQSANVNATIFNGIEDVEIGPDGMVYFAVKNESQVYRFQDSNPESGTSFVLMETYVGNMSYDIQHNNGVTNYDWGIGNDNLAFDGEGNLWVLQDRDGFDNWIWVVENGHTQTNPKVKLFARCPEASEPTGITFSPDYRFIFLSIQHPSLNNGVTQQEDAAGDFIGFDKDISMVIALAENLGDNSLSVNENPLSKNSNLHPNPSSNYINLVVDKPIPYTIYNINGLKVLTGILKPGNSINIESFLPGTYILKLKDFKNIKFIKK